MIIIGIHGLAGVGKTTAADILGRDWQFVRVPFAGPLKRMATEYGLSQYEITDRHAKERPFDRKLPELTERLAQKMLIAMGIPLTDLCLTPHKPLPYLGGKTAMNARADLVRWWGMYRDQITSPRRFMQLIGTEWGRGMVCPSLWLNMWDLECREVADECSSGRIVVDDLRFANEARHIREQGGKVIEIRRTGIEAPAGAGHSSENGIPEDLIDITIWNDGDKDVLAARMGGILDRFYSSEAL